MHAESAQVSTKVNCPVSATMRVPSIAAVLFPEPVPSDTSIPAWAFLDPTSDGNFDLKDAQALADGSAPAPDSHITSTNPIQGPTLTLEGDQGSTSTLTGDFHNSAGNPPASGSPDLASSSPGQGSATLTITGPLSSSDVITTGSAVGDRSSSRPTSGGATQSSGGSTTIVNWKTATATWTLQENGTVTSSVTQTQTQSSTALGSSRKTRLTNAVIAGTVSAGVIAFLAAGIGGFIVYRRRTSSRHRQRRRNGGNDVAATASPSSRAHWRKTSVQIPHTPKEDAIRTIPAPTLPLLSEIARMIAPTSSPRVR
ncbi:hypothetical protein BN946_scf185043.g198 [Trametes cinnabarina]|uniref:Uncharacterized protein n=1 Tax=Pycnoporus cinnabarinus TaxID=5643 RepID=A0A060SNW8_PYCCI|nr:hypothetical protein BN946_scf185043.g198 [Trametes cinnabarina]